LKIFTILYVAVAVKQRQRQRQRWTLQEKQLRMSNSNSLGANSQGCAHLVQGNLVQGPMAGERANFMLSLRFGT
jgi:hypothetical protein